jgi:cytochrome c553
MSNQFSLYKAGLSRLVTLFFMAFIATSCSHFDDHNHPEITTAAALYNYHCAECHGEDGTGKLVDRTPANILTSHSREWIVSYVTTNINPRRKMPVFSAMPKAEIAAISTHLLKLQQVYSETPDNIKKPRMLMIEP